jgi:hypothetical protein
VDFLGGDGRFGGVELLDVDFFVAGALLEEDEEASADGSGDGRRELDAEEDVGRGWSLCAGYGAGAREDCSR